MDKEKTSKVQFSLSSSNVKKIIFEQYEQDFTFIVNGKHYKTSRFLADFLSPIVNRYHYEDSSIDFMIININEQTEQAEQEEGEDYFSSFLKLSNFETTEIDEKRLSHYLEYFLKLGNIDEYFRLQPDYFSGMNVNNIVGRLKSMKQEFANEQWNECIKQALNYASTNFENISKDDLESLDVEILESIISNDQLKLKDESSLLKFILELYSKDKKKYSILFEYVIFKNVDENTLSEFINQFDIEGMNIEIWRRICQRLISAKEETDTEEKKQMKLRYNNNGNDKYEGKIIHKEHQSGNEFNGLLRYLSENSNGNIHDNGTVNITSNSIYDNNNICHPKNLVDYQNIKSNYYYSKYDISDGYVCFDFKERRIQLSSYSIKTYLDGQNGRHLKNWVIEVSNDNTKWNTIDEHQNDSTLNGSRITATFNINKNSNNNNNNNDKQSQFYRFIRLRQSGHNWQNDYHMLFYCIEFYGKLIEPTTKTNESK